MCNHKSVTVSCVNQVARCWVGHRCTGEWLGVGRAGQGSAVTRRGADDGDDRPRGSLSDL